MSNHFTYHVQKSDTGTSIASKFGLTFDPTLKSANPDTNWNDLQINSTLNIPSWQYKVQSGDTGDSLAQKDKITIGALEAANPNVKWNDLQIGQMLNVPGKKNF